MTIHLNSILYVIKHHPYSRYFFYFQDLQAEVDANKGTYDSLNTAGNQLTRTMVAADAQRLQRRLEEMNQRWINLMTKSMEIRYYSRTITVMILSEENK